MNVFSFRVLKGGRTNWGYVVILIIWTIFVAGGILGYAKYVFKQIDALSQFPEIEIQEEIED